MFTTLTAFRSRELVYDPTKTDEDMMTKLLQQLTILIVPMHVSSVTKH